MKGEGGAQEERDKINSSNTLIFITLIYLGPGKMSSMWKKRAEAESQLLTEIALELKDGKKSHE